MLLDRLGLRSVALVVVAFGATPALAINANNAFASFVTQPGGTFYWQNDINAPVPGNGMGGALFSQVTPGPNVPGVIPISFSWLSAGLSNINAELRFYGATTNQPAVTSGLAGASFSQTIQSGFFDISNPLSNVILLSATFTGAEILGTIGGANATVFAFAPSFGSVSYTSTFAPIPPGLSYFFLQKTGIVPLPSATPGMALDDFDPAVSGAFGIVPEPGTWALMIVGFGLVGTALRRRERVRV